MLQIQEKQNVFGSLMNRREMMRVGALGLSGIMLPELLQARSKLPGGSFGKAKNCILFFLEGGPAHQDLWDMKPEAPAEIRGTFRPISTTVPGVQVCEHLPLLAKQMHHVAQIRSVHHNIVDHNAGAFYMFTGHSPQVGNRLILGDGPGNFPPYGAVLSRLKPVEQNLPSFVHLPDIMSNNGRDLPGQRAGFLGKAFDPFVIGDPSAPGYRVPGLSLPDEITNQRLVGRRRLLAHIDQRLGSLRESREVDGMSKHYRKAFELIASDDARQAFDLTQESQQIRELYGLPDRIDRSVEARKFGGLPHLGQCMLLARRLIESGVRLVTVCTGRRFDQAWDTHRDHFPLLKKSLLPYTNQALSALLEDLDQRGLLDETLVVAMGEFGRTPKLGQITSSAGAEADGRDHWPHCYTVLMAGGGVRGGAVYGASDAYAAKPISNPVTPEDVAATIYHALGIEQNQRIYDQLNRPHRVAEGKPILEIFG